jgi:hypothetical protein
VVNCSSVLKIAVQSESCDMWSNSSPRRPEVTELSSRTRSIGSRLLQIPHNHHVRSDSGFAPSSVIVVAMMPLESAARNG